MLELLTNETCISYLLYNPSRIIFKFKTLHGARILDRHKMCFVGQIMYVKLWICLSSVWIASSFGQYRNVNTKIGDIVGSIENAEVVDFNGTYVVGKYVQYLGIPYAEPPLGDLRFAKPKPKAALTEPHNGTFYRPACHQGNDAASSTNHALLKSKEFSEDCLTLDVYVPFSDIKETYPVVIFIHGGSYISGGSKGYVADVFSVYGNVITVVINYRLGVLGFFSLGDSVMPGNYGLWDQHLAIKWTVDNIANFGGDVNKVTILGHSSGSSSAILQALYPENKGLFTRVIAQSGSPIPALKFSSFMGTPTGNSIAEAMDCKEGSSNKILECMRGKTLEEIDAGMNRASNAVSLAPVIDHDFLQYNPEEALIGDDNSTWKIRDIFSSLGLLSGINNMDGIMHLSYIWATMLNQNVSDLEIDSVTFENTIIPTMLNIFLYDSSANVSDVVTSLISFQYSDLRDPENSGKIRENLLSMSSDVDFSIPAIKTANLHSSLNNQSGTYFYEFSAGLNLTTSSTPSWLEGAGHGEEMFFLLGFSKKTLEAWSHMHSYIPGTEKEIQTSRRLIKAWTNFIHSG